MIRAITYVGALVLIAAYSMAAPKTSAASKPGQTPAQSKSVAELLDCLERATASLQDYSVDGVTETNGKLQRFMLTFRRPHLVRVDTRSGQVAVQPNGDIKGRLGHGPVGHIAQKLSRNDRRLRDSEGIPFHESDFVSMVARMQAQVNSSAAASMTAEPTAYSLEIHQGDTVWRYKLDRNDFSVRETSRSVNGKQVEITRFTDFQPNTGVKETFFRF